MRILRVVVMFVAAYVGMDVLDPSVPGVFFFESDHLFIDGVSPAKTTTPSRILASRAGSPRPWIDRMPRVGGGVRLPARDLRSTLQGRPPTGRPRHALISAPALDDNAHA